MNEPVSVMLLASGRGTNIRALLEQQKRRKEFRDPLVYQINAVFSDSKQAMALDIAQEFGVLTYVSEVKKSEDKTLSRVQQENELIEFAKKCKAEWLVLCGYTRLLSENVIRSFWNESKNVSKIVNIHPSLLPAYPGLHSYRKAFEAREKETGVTIHLVDEKLDHGAICAQESFSISDCKTIEEVESRGLSVEHRLYDQTLMWLLKNTFNVKLESGRLRVCQS
jgi:phosphoribosylglycinamide formyltransferase-1